MGDRGLYNAMFQRKSIRKYDMQPLDAGVLAGIKNYIGQLKPLLEDIKIEFTFAKDGEVKNLQPVKAPHYVMISSEKKDDHLYNAGFMGQQINLYLTAHGLGSCWLGMAKPQAAVKAQSDLDFIIMLAFGKPAEPLYRTEVSQFKRKPMSEISFIQGGDELLEPVRLAPSAVNRQPWCFYGTTAEIHIGRAKLNPITSQVYDRLNQIDIGIALCHLAISAEHMGKSVRFSKNSGQTIEAPKGYRYVITANISDAK